jgi:hypothetical protein
VYTAGAAAEFSTAPGVEITARYEIEGRADYTDQAAMVNVRWSF